MARRRPHSRRAVAALDWRTPSDVVASLFELEDVDSHSLRDHQLYVDAVRWARAHDHPLAYWLAVTPNFPAALSWLLWDVHRIGVSSPAASARLAACVRRSAPPAIPASFGGQAPF